MNYRFFSIVSETSQFLGERSYICTVEGCGKTFTNQPNLAGHIKSTHKKSLDVCPICHAEVKVLRSHIKMHNKLFVCTQNEKGMICNKRYSSNAQLKKHVKNSHLGVR